MEKENRSPASNLPADMPSSRWNLVADAVEASVAPGTRAVYASHWRTWQRWCAENGVPDLPTTPEHLAVYLAERAQRHAMSTVRTAAAAIGYHHTRSGHPNPAQSMGVVLALRGLARQYRRQSKQVQGLTAIRMAGISATAHIPRHRETKADAELRGITDLAMIGLMRDALLRRSETSALTWSDLKEWQDGSGRIDIAFSKTDQTGEGAVGYVSAQTMRWLRQVREKAGRETIIGLCPHQIARRIVSAAAEAGLQGRYGGHSPRVGMAQDLAGIDAGLANLMQAGRWKRAETVLLYIRNIAAGNNAVASWYARRGE